VEPSLNYNIQTLKVTLYEDTQDWVRGVMEILLAAGVALAAYMEIKEAWNTYKETGSIFAHFSSFWNYIDALSIGLNIAACIIWWDFVFSNALAFKCDLRYDVYKDLASPARILQYNHENPLNAESEQALGDSYGAQLDDLVSMYNQIDKMTQMQLLYMTLNGINIMLMLLRILKLMDFQPRMGVVTRSLGLAASDLGHFFILAMIIFVGYAMMAHLIFGYSIQKFSTLGEAINTCFEILLGEIGVNTDLMKLNSLEKIPAVIFFWSYEILVFMILLNFLLAIIVDAFSDVKSQIEESRGLPSEVGSYLAESFKSTMSAIRLGYKDYVSDAAIKAHLEDWANDVDEEDDESDDEGERVIKIGDEDVDADQILAHLRTCSAVGGKAASTTYSETELKRISDAIMDRFGEDRDADELEARARKLAKMQQRQRLVDSLAAVLDGQEKILLKLHESNKLQK